MVQFSGWSKPLLSGLVFVMTVAPLDTTKLRSITVPESSGVCNLTVDSSTHYSYDSSLTTLHPPPITSTMTGQRVYCTYSFHGSHHQRVMLNIRSIKLGQFDSVKNRCVHAFLRIWDGLSGAGRHRHPPNTLCGHTGELPLWKFSTGRDLEVEYQVEYSRVYMDFTLQYRFIDMEKEAETYPYQLTHDMKPTVNSSSLCDFTINLEDCSGECQILSPGYPGMYPPNVECVYRVVSRSPEVMMQLSFQGPTPQQKMRSFNLRPSPRCTKDYLLIQDNSVPADSRDVTRLCGDKTHDILSAGNNITLRFRSSDEQAPFGFDGFHLSVMGFTKEWNPSGQPVPGTLCDWDFTSPMGSVSTPDHWLPHGATCTYNFHLDKGFMLKFRLNVYGLRSGCSDEIRIYQHDTLTERLCDRNLPQEEDGEEHLTLQASSSQVRVVYKTVEGQFQGQSHHGFWMSFQQVPGNTQVHPVKDKNREDYLTSHDTSHDWSGDPSSANQPTVYSPYTVLVFAFLSQIILVRCPLLWTSIKDGFA